MGRGWIMGRRLDYGSRLSRYGPPLKGAALRRCGKVSVRRWVWGLSLCFCVAAFAQTPRSGKKADLWVLKPVVRPAVPSGTKSVNPIDAFIAAEYAKKGLRP